MWGSAAASSQQHHPCWTSVVYFIEISSKCFADLRFSSFLLVFPFSQVLPIATDILGSSISTNFSTTAPDFFWTFHITILFGLFPLELSPCFLYKISSKKAEWFCWHSLSYYFAQNTSEICRSVVKEKATEHAFSLRLYLYCTCWCPSRKCRHGSCTVTAQQSEGQSSQRHSNVVILLGIAELAWLPSAVPALASPWKGIPYNCSWFTNDFSPFLACLALTVNIEGHSVCFYFPYVSRRAYLWLILECWWILLAV